MTELTCNNCKYKWNYQGTHQYYATCPKCRYKVPTNEYKKMIPKKMQQLTGKKTTKITFK